MQKAIKTFIDLVKIPSPSGKEQAVRKYIIDQIKNFVDEVFIDKIGNLYLRINGKSKEFLLLGAHLDTVEPTGVQKPIIKNDVIYSNGKYVLGGDNKVAIAAILNSIKRIKQENKFSPSLELLFTVREETEGGICQFPKEKIKAKKGLIMDLSQPIGEVIIGAPFVGGYSITVRAKGGHVRHFQKETVHPLNFLLNFTKKIPLGRLNKDSIVNISKIRMGETYNNIPEELYFAGEIRTFDKKRYQKFFKDINKVTEILDKKFKTKTKLDLYPYCQGYLLETKDLKPIKKTLEKLNLKYKSIKTFAVGDFSILNGWGIKTINIGNGTKDVHTTKESVSFNSILLLEKILDEYVKLFY